MNHHRQEKHLSRPWEESSFYRFGRDSSGEYQFSSESLPQNFRFLGKGQIGGKARGLLFVLDHLAKNSSLTSYDDLLRFPDCLVIRTGVFDKFLDANGLSQTVLSRCDEKLTPNGLYQTIVGSSFPISITKSLQAFLSGEHRPLVVRSSSLMEDSAEHSFAGIYLSEFLANTGSMEQRLWELIGSIKRVYASTFGENARAYRKRHGLSWQDEKMAVLIQNMIGQHYPEGLFYPLIGGVAFSLNFYPWSERLRSEDGIVRLVVGVGTRAVGREYARVFSPKIPGLRPEGSGEKAVIKYSQEMVDVLDMRKRKLSHVRLSLLNNPVLQKVCSIVDSDGSLSEPVSALSLKGRYIASFERFIATNSIMPFTAMLNELLGSLEELFQLPVDIEFAVNFPKQGQASTPLLYLLQARPLGGRPEHRIIRLPKVSPQDMLLLSQRALGNGVRKSIRDLVFVDASTYRWQEGHAVARRVGMINDSLADKDYILIGPGRWGTSNPQLGVPVRYGEIAGAAVIVEMATEAFSPEMSYGTHFYADMVASDVLYLPLDESQGDYLNRELLDLQTVISSDPFVKHVHFNKGLDVYVDGENKRSLICVSNWQG
jgi:hypothetical protein